MIQKLKVFHRHAVHAAKIASVSNRDPQIGDLAIVVVYVSSHTGIPLLCEPQKRTHASSELFPL
jgi:hypothetical protein